MDDGIVAERLAHQAGEILMRHRGATTLSGVDLARSGDQVSNAFLLAALAVERPGQPVLSEESPDDLSRLAARRIWIIDPLDGSREFGEGRSDFAVHVAVSVDGDAVAGAVSLPASRVTYTTARPPLLGACAAEPLRIAVSRTRPPPWIEPLGHLLHAQLVPMGSMGAKAMAVIRGETQAYVHAGGQHEWDSAAPVAVARAAGLYVSDLDGASLVFNRRNVMQSGLIVCRPYLAASLTAGLTVVRRAALS